MIVTIDNYLKFLHPIQQQENPIWEEFYNVFCSKTRNARSQRPGKYVKINTAMAVSKGLVSN